MTRAEYRGIEGYMLQLMRDSAHDMHHVYRVLYAAVDIARHTPGADADVLVAACLLHDIGRAAQFSDRKHNHAKVGADMAHAFLLARDWPKPKAKHVKDCIASHRYRGKKQPETLEAKILFDADKLDACGALGIARTLQYGGITGEPLYLLDENGTILAGGGGEEDSSFFQEYNYKLANLYGRFYTPRAKELAAARRRHAVDFYNGLHGEIAQTNEAGVALLEQMLCEDG